MREKRNVAWGQSAPVVAIAAALWVTGVVALPLIFGGPAGTVGGLPWLGAAGAGLAGLGVALLVTVSLLALVQRLAPLLALGTYGHCPARAPAAEPAT